MGAYVFIEDNYYVSFEAAQAVIEMGHHFIGTARTCRCPIFSTLLLPALKIETGKTIKSKESKGVQLSESAENIDYEDEEDLNRMHALTECKTNNAAVKEKVEKTELSKKSKIRKNNKGKEKEWANIQQHQSGSTCGSFLYSFS